MPLFVTPGSLNSRASLYHQLAQLTAAGIGLQAALEMQQRNPPAIGLRQELSLIVRELQAGSTFAESLRGAGSRVPLFDVALLHAGEQSGRLPNCFSLLARHYESSAILLRQMLSSLMYPALLFHMAVLVAPLPDLFRSWNLIGYAIRVLMILLPVYVGVGAIGWALNGRHRDRGLAALESVLHRVPLLGRARRHLALARLASALEALISAGVGIIEAWKLAADASGSPALRDAVYGWSSAVEIGGMTPAEALRGSPEFPELFTNLYQTGELTGSLDQTLGRLQTLYQEEGSRQMKSFTDWLPKLIYFGVMLLVAWQVIRFWTGYFDSIGQVFGT